MTRWNLLSILLYSHDDRRTEVNLVPNSVNVISGNSKKGKSSLVEIIDYALGSSDCHIPAFVRDSCSWFGTIWANGPTKILVCRRAPAARQRVSADFVVLTGSEIRIPSRASELTPNASLDGALRQFERLLGMGEVRTSPVGSQAPARITVRNCMPFVLQDDDVIISKVNLLRGGNDQRRQSVIDTLPYFLGLVDESTVALESQLRRLRAALTSIQRRNAQLNRDRNEESSRALALVREAAAVGLAAAPTEATTVDEAFAILRDVAAWEGGDVQEVDESQLQALNARERELLNVLRRLRGQASAANELMRAASSFSDTASSQLRRLQVVDLLPSEPASDHCPLCSQNLESATPSTIVVRQALDQIASDLRSVETERPRLGQYVSRRLDEANDVQQQLNGVRREIRALVQQSEAVQRSIQVDNQRYHTVGRASLYLESFDPDSAQAGPDNTDALQAEIASIERQISRDAQEEANADVRLSLSNAATSILRALPFEDRYREFSVDFNPRDLSVGVITPQRRITMRGVGSDENYLSLHIAFLLAFHRHFASNQRPVPGLVVFDQLSRPFFPAEVNQDQLIMARIDERRELHQFFDVLFNEVERNEGLQVLVLEHAFFQEDNRFVEATRYMWTDSGLIPTGWPQVDHGTATNDSVQASLEFD